MCPELKQIFSRKPLPDFNFFNLKSPFEEWQSCLLPNSSTLTTLALLISLPGVTTVSMLLQSQKNLRKHFFHSHQESKVVPANTPILLAITEQDPMGPSRDSPLPHILCRSSSLKDLDNIWCTFPELDERCWKPRQMENSNYLSAGAHSPQASWSLRMNTVNPCDSAMTSPATNQITVQSWSHTLRPPAPGLCL